MRMDKLLIALGALLLGGPALAATTFVCGTVACSAFGTQPITGIDDLVVDGDHFNVTFSTQQDSTFLFSSLASGSGQPLTGVDAANALDAFYATQQGPTPQSDGPGIFASVGGVDVDVVNLVTAFQVSSTPGLLDIDITTPFLGGGFQGPVLQAPDLGDGLPAPGGLGVSHVDSGFVCSAFATCTKWTPVSAVPEISPLSAPSAIALLLGSLAVLRGRRPRQSVAPHN